MRLCQQSVNRTLFVLLLMLIMPLASYSYVAAGELISDDITWDNQTRTFQAYVPDSATSSPETVRSLVFCLHGLGGSGAIVRAQTNQAFEQWADTTGAIIIYPDGINKRWNSDLTVTANTDDVGFLTELATHAASRWNVDLDRWLVTGISNGGLLSFRLARERGQFIAAIAPVVALLPDPDEDGASYYSLPQPIPLLMIAGTADAIFPYTGGDVTLGAFNIGNVLSAPATFDLFMAENGLDITTSVTTTALPNTAIDLTTTDLIATDGHPPGTAVQLYRVNNGAHNWPGGSIAGSGNQSRDFMASDKISAFFDNEARPAASHRSITIRTSINTTQTTVWDIAPQAPFTLPAATETLFHQLNPTDDTTLSASSDISNS